MSSQVKHGLTDKTASRVSLNKKEEAQVPSTGEPNADIMKAPLLKSLVEGNRTNTQSDNWSTASVCGTDESSDEVQSGSIEDQGAFGESSRDSGSVEEKFNLSKYQKGA